MSEQPQATSTEIVEPGCAAPVVRLEQITRAYRQASGAIAFALQPTTLDFFPGTWSVITGRSGSGKTTLINLICGLDRPDRGRVCLFSEDLAQYSDAALAELRRDRLGIVYQRYFFVDHLPVWQNISCRLVPAGIGAAQRRQRAERLLHEFGLAGVADRLPRDLSGGEQQRVALARAVVNDPAILVADEPTSNVDEQTAQSIIRHLKSLQQRGTTVMIATHDPALLEGADQRYTMEEGRIRPA